MATQNELDALQRRAELLSAKVDSLEQNGFTRDEAMQIVFKDIEAGLTVFGTTATTTSAAGALGVGGDLAPAPPEPPLVDLSVFVGTWQVTPSPLHEECQTPFADMIFQLRAETVEIAFTGADKSRMSFIFRSGASSLRAEGTAAQPANKEIEFLGRFDTDDVKIKLTGRQALTPPGDPNNPNALPQETIEAVIKFIYERSSLFSLPSGCGNTSHPRTLVRV